MWANSVSEHKSWDVGVTEKKGVEVRIEVARSALQNHVLQGVAENLEDGHDGSQPLSVEKV